MKKIKTKKQYTVSTFIFDSLAEAERQCQEWNHNNELASRTKVFEITGIAYKPLIKLVKQK